MAKETATKPGSAGASGPAEERKGRASASQQATDALSLLEQQHRAVEEVFEELRSASTGQRSQHIRTLAELLIGHATIEEQVFYPAVRTADTEEILAESFHDHYEVKKVLLHLLDAKGEDPDLGEMVEELEGMIEDHVLAEEGELFPQVRGLMSADQLEALGQEMIALQAQESGQVEPKAKLAEELAAADLAP